MTEIRARAHQTCSVEGGIREDARLLQSNDKCIPLGSGRFMQIPPEKTCAIDWDFGRKRGLGLSAVFVARQRFAASGDSSSPTPPPVR